MKWTDEEVEFLTNNPQLSYLRAAIALGRTRASVRRKAERMRKPVVGPRRRRGARPGEEHYNAKLSEAMVREMREKYASGGYSHFTLWQEYYPLVESVSTISLAVRGKTWKHI